MGYKLFFKVGLGDLLQVRFNLCALRSVYEPHYILGHLRIRHGICRCLGGTVNLESELERCLFQRQDRALCCKLSSVFLPRNSEGNKQSLKLTACLSAY